MRISDETCGLRVLRSETSCLAGVSAVSACRAGAARVVVWEPTLDVAAAAREATVQRCGHIRYLHNSCPAMEAEPMPCASQVLHRNLLPEQVRSLLTVTSCTRHSLGLLASLNSQRQVACCDVSSDSIPDETWDMVVVDRWHGLGLLGWSAQKVIKTVGLTSISSGAVAQAGAQCRGCEKRPRLLLLL